MEIVKKYFNIKNCGELAKIISASNYYKIYIKN